MADVELAVLDRGDASDVLAREQTSGLLDEVERPRTRPRVRASIGEETSTWWSWGGLLLAGMVVGLLGGIAAVAWRDICNKIKSLASWSVPSARLASKRSCEMPEKLVLKSRIDAPGGLPPDSGSTNASSAMRYDGVPAGSSHRASTSETRASARARSEVTTASQSMP